MRTKLGPNTFADHFVPIRYRRKRIPKHDIQPNTGAKEKLGLSDSASNNSKCENNSPQHFEIVRLGKGHWHGASRSP